MNIAAVFAIASAAIGIGLSLILLVLTRAPGWGEQRPFAAVALTAGLAAATNFHWSLPVGLPVADLFARLQLLFLGIHVVAWHVHAARATGGAPRPAWLALLAGTVVASGLCLVPGLVYGEAAHHTALGIDYLDLRPTPAGMALLTFLTGSALHPLWRFTAAWGRGVRGAGVFALCLVALLLMAGNDALVTAGLVGGPYLMDFGFLVPVAVAGMTLTQRFTADARAHHALRLELEQRVEARTRELAQAQEALHQSEKLAALARLSAGVAHEINNPAAAALANLEYVEGQLQGPVPPAGEALDALRETRHSVDRIARTVRELGAAGRAAMAAGPAREPVPLAEVMEAALRAARLRFGERVRLESHPVPGLRALAQAEPLTQALVHLIANAVQAVEPGRADGLVVVRAARAGDRVRLAVEDNGAGMDPAVLRRVFEPYFSTRAFGDGVGLGLAISRGLVVSLGGELSLESAPGKGTRAAVELDAAPGP